MAEKTAAVELVKQELAQSEATLSLAVVALERAVQQNRAAAAKARKAEAAAAKKALKEWLSMGLPQPLAVGLMECGIIGAAGPAAGSLLEDSVPGGDREGAVESGYKATVVQVTSNAADWQSLLWVSGRETAELPVLGGVRKVLATDLGSRVAVATNKLSVHMRQNPHLALGVCRMSSSGNSCGASSQPVDTEFDSFLWLPESLRGAAEAPEAVSSFGAPWMMTMRPHAFRGDCVEFPLLGFSRVAVVVSGCMAVLAWNLKVTDDLAIPATAAHQWFRSLSRAEVVDAVKAKTVVHCRLEPNDTLWLPNGWAALWLNVGSVPCDTAYIPVLSHRRVCREIREDVRRGVCLAGEAFVQGNLESTTWKESLGPALTGWLQHLKHQ